MKAVPENMKAASFEMGAVQNYYACIQQINKEKINYNKEVVFMQNVGIGFYRWKEDGKKRYRKWFNIFYQCHRKEGSDLKKSVIAGRDYITRVSQASTWAWDDGLRLLFWRWGEDYWKEARDGARIWVQDKLPKFTNKQKVSKDKARRDLEQKKVQKV